MPEEMKPGQEGNVKEILQSYIASWLKMLEKEKLIDISSLGPISKKKIIDGTGKGAPLSSQVIAQITFPSDVNTQKLGEHIKHLEELLSYGNLFIAHFKTSLPSAEKAPPSTGLSGERPSSQTSTLPVQQPPVLEETSVVPSAGTERLKALIETGEEQATDAAPLYQTSALFVQRPPVEKATHIATPAGAEILKTLWEQKLIDINDVIGVTQSKIKQGTPIDQKLVENSDNSVHTITLSKNFKTTDIPTIRKHLEHLERIQDSCDYYDIFVKGLLNRLIESWEKQASESKDDNSAGTYAATPSSQTSATDPAPLYLFVQQHPPVEKATPVETSAGAEILKTLWEQKLIDLSGVKGVTNTKIRKGTISVDEKLIQQPNNSVHTITLSKNFNTTDTSTIRKHLERIQDSGDYYDIFVKELLNRLIEPWEKQASEIKDDNNADTYAAAPPSQTSDLSVQQEETLVANPSQNVVPKNMSTAGSASYPGLFSGSSSAFALSPTREIKEREEDKIYEKQYT